MAMPPEAMPALFESLLRRHIHERLSGILTDEAQRHIKAVVDAAIGDLEASIKIELNRQSAVFLADVVVRSRNEVGDA